MKVCKICGEELEWARCYQCGGEGGFDGYDEDPLWYDPGDIVPCSECFGRGYYFECPRPEEHPFIIAAQPPLAPDAERQPTIAAAEGGGEEIPHNL